ncbi:hypothetical protein GCM10027419_48580 [Pandoraea terrae]
MLEQYGTEVSPEFVNSVTDSVMDEVLAWQSRPLVPMYPVVFFDALRVKIRSDGVVRNTAVHLALSILPDGTRDILGLWIENTEGAKFRLKVFNDLKTRGVQAILIAVTDGLQGMEEALGAVFPASLRKIIKTRGHFPSDDAATKLLWLALRGSVARGSTAPDWHSVCPAGRLCHGLLGVVSWQRGPLAPDPACHKSVLAKAVIPATGWLIFRNPKAARNATSPPAASGIYAHPHWWVQSSVAPNVIGASAPAPNPKIDLTPITRPR